MNNQIPQGLDPTAFLLTKAIKNAETPNHPDPYNAVGDNGKSFGAYQIQKQYWPTWAKQYLGDANAQPTEENQNKLAYMRVKSLLDKGHSQSEVASIWNSGRADPNATGSGYNPAVKANFNVPAYVEKVKNNYLQLQKQFVPTAEAQTNQIEQLQSQNPYTGALGTNLNDTAYGKLIDNSITRGIQSFFPGKKVGEAIGTLGGYVASGFNPNYDTSAPSPLQVAGDIAQGALMVGTGMPEGTVGVQAFGKVLPTLKTAETVGGKLLQNAVVGAGFGATEALKEGQTNPLDIAKSAGIGGAISGLAGGVAMGVGKLFSKLPESITNQTFKAPLGEIKKGIKSGEDTFAKQVLDHGIIGTNKSVYENSISKVAQNESALQDVLTTFDNTITKPGIAKLGERATGAISKSEVVPYFKDLVVRLKDTPGMGDEVRQVQRVFDDLPTSLSLSRANEIKRNLYYELGNPAYKLDVNLSTKREAMKTLARGLKDLIEKKTGAGTQANSVVNHFNRELAFYGKLRDRALTNMAKGSHLNLKDFSILGLGELIGGHPVALGAEAIKKTYGTTIAKTAIAQGLNKVNKLANTQTGKAIRYVGKTATKVATGKVSQ